MNLLSNIYSKYQKAVPNPLTQAGLLFLLGAGTYTAAQKPVKNMSKQLAATMAGTDPHERAKAQQDIQNWWTQDPRMKWGARFAAGFIPAAASLAMMYRGDQPWYGWKQWQPQMIKNGSLWQADGYQPVMNLDIPVNTGSVSQMLKTNPYLQNKDYARNLGVSIVNGADNIGGRTTLGNIFDSAVNKFDSKLTFDGLASGAVKTMVNTSLAGMFTDVVGTMVGMPPVLRNKASNAAAIGTALYSILN